MYQRPGRRGWWCSFSDKEKHISLGTEDETEAAEAFSRLLDGRRLRQLAPGEKSLTEVFAEARTRAESGGTPKSAYERHLNLKRILTWLEGRSAFTTRHVTRQLVEDYKSERRFTVGAGRINRELDSWRVAHRIAEEWHCAPKKSAEDLFLRMREPQPAPRRRIHTRKQLDAFVRAVPENYRSLFRAVLGCGLRDEELRHLRAVDVSRSEVTVTPQPGWATKSYRYRDIPISAPTRKALLTWIANRDGGKISTDKKRIWKVAQAACKAAKLTPLSLHDLRHAWASHLYHKAVPLKTISVWLGHRDAATTERYLGVIETKLPAGVKLPW